MAVPRSHQGISISGVAVLLATVLVVGHASGAADKEHLLERTRLLQNENDAVRVGIEFAPASGGLDNASTAAEDELVEALQKDDQVTVVGTVQLGTLLCDSLAGAEDASTLQFAVSPDETVLATQTSYTVVSGDAFTNGIGRKVWAGVVADAEAEDGTAVARTVSMTWGEVCDVETFLLKLTTQNADGSTSVLKSVPCDVGSSTDICMVEVKLILKPPAEPISPTSGVDVVNGPGSGRRLRATPDHEAKDTYEALAGQRNLQSFAKIDVMFLYSELGRESLGNISPAQIETTVLEALVWTNKAMANSDIDLVFSLVHVGPLPYVEESTDTYENIATLRSSADVGALRTYYGADLVQLIGSYDDGYCGRGYYFYDGDASLGFSVVGGNCLDGFIHTHEFGHNLGCRHNRENTGWDLDYAHGYRYCGGDDPYRTIMSYSCGTAQANYVSNPDVNYLNKPTGTDMADNARRINEYKSSVASYMEETTPPITPSPTPSPVSSGPVDAGLRTSVKVRTNAYDENTLNDGGCDPNGCTADKTRDSVLGGDSRWSCNRSLNDTACKLIYKLGDPQDIVSLKVAFFKGNERTRSFKVVATNSDGDNEIYEFTSSGETDGFENFELDSNETVKLIIKPDDPNKYDWLSIFEVEIMVN